MAKKRKAKVVRKQDKKNRPAPKRTMAIKRGKARSLASKKGWITRRNNSRKEFKRRSLAARKGWRRRRAKADIKKRAQAKPRGRGRLAEWLVTWRYHPVGEKPRVVDFVVIARNKESAELFVVKAAANGEDSEGADLTWLEKIPWDEVESVRMPDDEESLSKKEIRILGEGYVAIR